MAAVTRQPFAQLDNARLQNLTSIKNRQNAITVNTPLKGKRKASESLDTDDSENVDPTLSAKRAKAGSENSFFPAKDFVKPSPFVLTRAAPSLHVPVGAPAPREAFSPIKNAVPRSRVLLKPKSPTARINTGVAKSTPLSAPAGRSPTRGSKRVGILSKRRTGGSFGRVDPPSFNLGSAAPFSLDAALKGTIPSYSGRSAPVALPSLLGESELKASWFFDIHEDTPEQEMTNLLQHSTCTLDISSDEESELKARRDRDEGRNKENVPPLDDVSQTQAPGARLMAAAAAVNPDDMIFEKTRGPLAEMNAEDYYPEGCDGSSVFIVAGDEEEAEHISHGEEQQTNTAAIAPVCAAAPEVAPEQVPLPWEAEEDVGLGEVDADVSIDFLMGKVSDKASDMASDKQTSKAAVLEPIEGTGESFELWESTSIQDEAEQAAPGSPREELLPAP